MTKTVARRQYGNNSHTEQPDKDVCMRKLLLSLPLTLAVAAGCPSVPGVVQAQTAVTACGQTLSTPGEYTLAGDLDCSGTLANGVTITASNVTLHLAGH